MEGREEEEAQIFIYLFRGGWADEPPLQMILLGAAHPSAAPENEGIFRGGWGVSRP